MTTLQQHIDQMRERERQQRLDTHELRSEKAARLAAFGEDYVAQRMPLIEWDAPRVDATHQVYIDGTATLDDVRLTVRVFVDGGMQYFWIQAVYVAADGVEPVNVIIPEPQGKATTEHWNEAIAVAALGVVGQWILNNRRHEIIDRDAALEPA